MIFIEEIKENISVVDISGLETEPVIMSYDELQKTHRRLISPKGSEIAISLPLGSCLKDGDILYRDSGKVIYVSLKEETAIHVMPGAGQEWAKAAYNIGNMHQPVYLKEDGVYTPFDEGVLHIVEKLKLPFEVIKCKLDGERAGVQSGTHHGHYHNYDGHHHDHDHHHDHEYMQREKRNE